MADPLTRGPCVYLIQHIATGRAYVGVTTDVARRWSNHRSGCNRQTYIARAIALHGVAGFAFSVLDVFETETEALWWESWWIEYLNTRAPNGYNLTGGGEGCTSPTDDVRAKMSAAKLGRQLSDAHRAALSASSPLRGRPRDAGLVARTAAAHRGAKRSEVTRAKIAARAIGRRPSDETRAKLSAARTGKKQSPETIARRLASRRAGKGWRKRDG